MITEVKKSAWVAWKEKSAPSETLVGENGSHEAGDHPAQVVLHLEFHHHGTAYLWGGIWGKVRELIAPVYWNWFDAIIIVYPLLIKMMIMITI